jgi:hypothetical protein
MNDSAVLDDLVVCPTCDLVYRAPGIASHEKAVCQRCGTVLMAPRRDAGTQLVAVALTVLTLIGAASVFPFQTIGAAGVRNEASILDTAEAEVEIRTEDMMARADGTFYLSGQYFVTAEAGPDRARLLDLQGASPARVHAREPGYGPRAACARSRDGYRAAGAALDRQPRGVRATLAVRRGVVMRPVAFREMRRR